MYVLTIIFGEVLYYLSTPHHVLLSSHHSQLVDAIFVYFSIRGLLGSFDHSEDSFWFLRTRCSDFTISNECTPTFQPS